MPLLELIDETLDINSTGNYELALQVSPSGLAYCILDTLRNKFVLLRSYEPDGQKYFDTDKLEELIRSDDLITRWFKKMYIITPSLRSTLVPAPLYDPEKKDEYFTFNQVLEGGEIILENKTDDPEAFILFSFPKQINDFLKSLFPETPVYHHTKPLLNHISGIRKNIIDNYVHVHLEREFFNLIIYDRNTLKFYNGYSYRSYKDIIYFVLNVLKQLDVNQDGPICFSGLTRKYDDLYYGLTAHIRNPRYSEPSDRYTFSYVFHETDLHRFLNLFSVTGCE